MKLLYISNSRIPTEKAYGRQIMEMCSAFASFGVNLELIIPTRRNNLKSDPFDYYGVEKNFEIKKNKTIDPRFALKLPSGSYIKFQSLFFIMSLFFYFLFKKNKKDCIFYTRDEYLLPFLHLFSRKVVWEGHNMPNKKEYYLKYWKKCYKIVVISGALKNDLLLLGLNNDDIIIAHDGVDLEKFSVSENKYEIRKKLGLPVEKKIILYSGHFYAWKGVDILADVARKLNDYLFVFVGGVDSEFDNFKNKNNKENILYTGYVNPNKIPLFLASADVLVIPNSQKYLKSKYTSPMKLFEYMSVNVPIVASDLDNFKEVLNYNNAIFFEPDNAEDLKNKLNKILGSDELSAAVSSRALEDVKRYTWQKRSENIIKFIF